MRGIYYMYAVYFNSHCCVVYRDGDAALCMIPAFLCPQHVLVRLLNCHKCGHDHLIERYSLVICFISLFNRYIFFRWPCNWIFVIYKQFMPSKLKHLQVLIWLWYESICNEGFAGAAGIVSLLLSWSWYRMWSSELTVSIADEKVAALFNS